MNSDAAVYFLSQLGEARATTLRDAEAFQGILFVLERLGFSETKGKVKGIPGLGTYQSAIQSIADQSPLSSHIPRQYKAWHSSFDELYNTVKMARNDALHQGVFARHLTTHAIQLALTLEDAFMSGLSRVSEFMVRDPVCASLWQPISFVRQQMLANSYSYLLVPLPIQDEKAWHLISDYHIVKYLRSAKSNSERTSLLARTVEEAISSKLLALEEARCIQADTEIKDVIQNFEGKPLVVFDEHSQLVGILTSYDLL
jgi:hypothetical protein